MSAAHIYMIKTLLKAFGLNADELEVKLSAAQKVVLEFDLNELRGALQMVLDYREKQEQNEMRLMAIINHFMIVDPVLLQQVAVAPPISEGTENADKHDA